jgi:hypothetical protein
MYNKLNLHNKFIQYLGACFLLLPYVLVGCHDPSSGVQTLIEPSVANGFVQDVSIKSRESLLKEVADSIADWENFAQRRYGTFGQSLHDKFESFSVEFLPLLVDPGVTLRADDFLNFAARQNLDKTKPWAARDAYSAHLGEKIYYRGLMLSEEEFASIKTKGIQSASLRNNISPFVSINKNIISIISDRLSELNMREDPLMSVSESFDIARSVPCVKTADASKKVYVFKINLPALSLFSPDMKKEWFEEGFKDFLKNMGEPESTLPQLYFPAAMESFLQFQISVGEFSEVSVMEFQSTEACREVLGKARKSFGVEI